MKKERLDVLLVKKGLASSREKAKAIIMSGIVFVDGQREDKAGSTFDEKQEIIVKGKTLKYVSRGGLKLEKAMKNFDIVLKDKVCMDVGASTGGFTDCMLQNGAVKVYSVDVGHGQLDWKLRNDERVVCMERTNMRYMTEDDIDEKASFVSIDVSFISLTKILPAVYRSLKQEEKKLERKVLYEIQKFMKKSLRRSVISHLRTGLNYYTLIILRSKVQREILSIYYI